MTIPASVTAIGGNAFQYCTELASVTILDGVTKIGNRAFQGCTGLTSVTIPDSVTSIGEYAFEGCTSLTSVTIPSSVTSIGEYAFENCTILTSVTFADTESEWYWTDSSDYTNGKSMGAMSSEDTATNATKLVKTYYKGKYLYNSKYSAQ